VITRRSIVDLTTFEVRGGRKMNGKMIVIALAIAALVAPAAPATAQETPGSMVAAYDTLAKVILEVRQAEKDYVRAILDGHFHGAKMLMKRGAHAEAAAEMALFANEGDNAVGGVRKRLIEGGHHHNAAGEEAGIYEPGYVLVTKEGKQKMLAASTAMRQAADDDARKQAWQDFAAVAEELLKK
jgi:hypothetical protein